MKDELAMAKDFKVHLAQCEIDQINFERDRFADRAREIALNAFDVGFTCGSTAIRDIIRRRAETLNEIETKKEASSGKDHDHN